MAQQTAVEWLKKELENYGSSVHLTLFWSTFDKLYEHSKQMEKEQIINAWRNGDNDSMYEPKQLDEQAEQYYNETYIEDKTFKKKSQWTKVNKQQIT